MAIYGDRLLSVASILGFVVCEGHQYVKVMTMNRIVIVGGGTSGWMAAISLAAYLPDARITVIEPSSIGPIGVGESVTGVVQRFVSNPRHGLSLGGLFRNADATLKVGVWYRDWAGVPSEYLTPIDNPTNVFIHSYPQDLEDFFALATMVDVKIGETQLHGPMMRSNRVDFVRDDQGNVRNEYSMASCHVDAIKLAKWFKSEATGRDRVTHIDDCVVGYEFDGDSGFVKSVRLERGDVIEGDFFLDCSGFGRVLFEKAYSPEWEDYSSYIKVDSAIVRFADHSPTVDIPSFTSSHAMKNGWAWKIPTQSRLGNGYVYSSKYVDDDQAAAEFGVDTDVIRFKPGKFRCQWIKNVCAIGSAGGFLEPLEATTIHTISVQIQALAELFLSNYSRDAADVLSKQFNGMMDQMYTDFVDFISFHYHTGRSDSEFWRDYQKSESMTPRNQERMEKWRYCYPVREDFAFNSSHRFFLTTSIMVWMPMLCGMGILSKEAAKRLIDHSPYADLAKQNVRRHVSVRNLLEDRAMSHREAIAYLREQP